MDRFQQRKSLIARKLIASAIRLCAFIAGGRGNRRISSPIKRILLLNGAHIGDVIISTSLIPVLRSAYPDAEIGFLAGSWSSSVIKNHPEITYTHEIDHWRLNRSNSSLLAKLIRHWITSTKGLRQVRKIKYDVALALHCWYPDFVPLALRANIPVRIAFDQSLFAPFATHRVAFPPEDFLTQGARLACILNPLPEINKKDLSRRRSTLAPSTPAAEGEVLRLLNLPAELGSMSYSVIHIGSGEPARELPIEFWRRVAQELSRNQLVLFTGRGEREQRQIAAIMKGLHGCVSACDKLSWNGFVAAVRHATMLYGVESMAGHVAGAVGTPCTVVYTGTAGVARWRPDSENCTVFTQHVLCAPCGIPQGCDHMACILQIKPESILGEGVGSK